MSEGKILFQVEVPAALPLILSGLRSATIQIVSTATIAAYVALGGVGRYILDGLYQRNFEKTAAWGRPHRHPGAARPRGVLGGGPGGGVPGGAQAPYGLTETGRK